MRRAVGLLAVLPLLGGATPARATEDPCPRTAALRPGPGPGLFRTVAPFEHATSSRTQVFPLACSLAELTGGGPVGIAARRSPLDLATPYIAVTRRRGELFVYGYGTDAAAEGGFVASVDPRTLRERWRTRIRDAEPAGAWSYPGVLLAHGNGSLYAVYANVLVRLDPATGRTLARRELPEAAGGTGAAYNGMVVLPDGRIAAKGIERGPCAVAPAGQASAGAIAGLTCSVANGLPSTVVVVDPARLRILDRVTPPEPVTGRITLGRTGGRDRVYAAGRDHLFRFAYRRGRLALDRGWGPVRYRTGAQTPGTGPGLLGDWVVVQTIFLPSPEPLTLTAVSARDDRRVLRARPFAQSAGGRSWIVSKAALDAANRTVVTHDTAAGQMAALRLDERRGLTVRWRRPLSSLAFSALVGPRGDREVVIPDRGPAGDRVVWLGLGDGRLRARSRTLAPTSAPGNIVTPMTGGRFAYLSAEGRLWTLRPRRAIARAAGGA